MSASVINDVVNNNLCFSNVENINKSDEPSRKRSLDSTSLKDEPPFKIAATIKWYEVTKHESESPQNYSDQESESVYSLQSKETDLCDDVNINKEENNSTDDELTSEGDIQVEFTATDSYSSDHEEDFRFWQSEDPFYSRFSSSGPDDIPIDFKEDQCRSEDKFFVTSPRPSTSETTKMGTIFEEPKSLVKEKSVLRKNKSVLRARTSSENSESTLSENTSKKSNEFSTCGEDGGISSTGEESNSGFFDRDLFSLKPETKNLNMCIQCKKSKKALYIPYCDYCYRIKKSFLPPRPKPYRKRTQLNEKSREKYMNKLSEKIASHSVIRNHIDNFKLNSNEIAYVSVGEGRELVPISNNLDLTSFLNKNEKTNSKIENFKTINDLFPIDDKNFSINTIKNKNFTVEELQERINFLNTKLDEAIKINNEKTSTNPVDQVVINRIKFFIVLFKTLLTKTIKQNETSSIGENNLIKQNSDLSNLKSLNNFVNSSSTTDSTNSSKQSLNQLVVGVKNYQNLIMKSFSDSKMLVKEEKQATSNIYKETLKSSFKNNFDFVNFEKQSNTDTVKNLNQYLCSQDSGICSSSSQKSDDSLESQDEKDEESKLKMDLKSTRQDFSKETENYHTKIDNVKTIHFSPSLNLELDEKSLEKELKDEEEKRKKSNFRMLMGRQFSASSQMSLLTSNFSPTDFSQRENSNVKGNISAPVRVNSIAGDIPPNDLCTYCFKNPKNGMFFHKTTGHVCCCYSCAVKVWVLRKQCPACNMKVSNIIKVFSI